jgi:putative SOS response-associated peptidase YedK
MCGRYVNAKARGDLLAYYEAQENEGRETPPSWNVALTQDVPIVAERLDEEGELHRGLITARWGLVRPGPRTSRSAPSFSALTE